MPPCHENLTTPLSLKWLNHLNPQVDLNLCSHRACLLSRGWEEESKLANNYTSYVITESSLLALIIFSSWCWQCHPCHLFAIFLAIMQMNKTLYYSILLKWCLKLYFQTVLSHTALINVVVFGLGNKLIMEGLLGEGDSLFPLEPFSWLLPGMHNVKYSEN